MLRLAPVAIVRPTTSKIHLLDYVSPYTFFSLIHLKKILKLPFPIDVAEILNRRAIRFNRLT